MRFISVDPKLGVYATTSDYVHAIVVQGSSRLLFISGTMGLDENWIAPDGVDEQLSLAWRNISIILSEAGMTVDNIVRATSYLRDHSFSKSNERARLVALKGRLIPTTAIVAETLSDKWLVEIEVIAAG